MSLKSFLTLLAIDTLVLGLTLVLRFKILKDLPINWNTVLLLLFLFFAFVTLALINISIALIRRYLRSQGRYQQERPTFKLTAETKPAVIILLCMAICSLTGGVTAFLTKLDLNNLDGRTGISFDQILSNLLLAIIFVTLAAPLAAIWGLLTINVET